MKSLDRVSEYQPGHLASPKNGLARRIPNDWLETNDGHLRIRSYTDSNAKKSR